MACIPLSIRLHDGLQAAMEWKDAAVSSASYVIQMVEDAYQAASTPAGRYWMQSAPLKCICFSPA